MPLPRIAMDTIINTKPGDNNVENNLVSNVSYIKRAIVVKNTEKYK
ncbi:hypothetical protein SDC9_98091 [bioreactor metagenome]|uniref:Uncharacterized protein n=1 Tax=bioreactor metagenome TaxID=1076179 RepID=A0A645AKF3_9ZZZZ